MSRSLGVVLSATGMTLVKGEGAYLARSFRTWAPEVWPLLLNSQLMPWSWCGYVSVANLLGQGAIAARPWRCEGKSLYRQHPAAALSPPP